MYTEDELLALSGIQHYSFCPRQWALIHIEQQWAENLLTVQGDLVHRRAHDQTIREKRGNVITVRGLNVHSYELGFNGQCDVVEFRSDPEGVSLNGEQGSWLPTPVEYKRGKKKAIQADRLQLCAQAICLEEMLCCRVKEAYLYYDQTRSRERVVLSQELRAETQKMADEMHRLYRQAHTPKMKQRAACRSCSIKDLCVPEISKRETVKEYANRRMSEIL